MIRKRFEIVNRMMRITGKIPIRWVKKFVFGEGEIHRGEQKAFITSGRNRRMANREKDLC